MNSDTDSYRLGKNVQTIVLIIVAIILMVDVWLRISSNNTSTELLSRNSTAAVGYHHQFPDGSWYYIYTVFEVNGDVYQVWWDGKVWNQKKVSNYRTGTSSK
jgi:hypothetical protein